MGATLVFGFALLLWFLLFALIVTAFVVARQSWYRWRYSGYAVQESAEKSKPDTKIIEVEYEDISNRK